MSKGSRQQAAGIRRTYWIARAELELEAVYLIHINGIRIEDSDVHIPLVEAVCSDQANAWW
jgi:hypothetical protein